MKEIFQKLPRITLNDKVDYLIDTCFFVYIFEHHMEIELSDLSKEKRFALTSFNVEELLHIHHKLHNNVNIAIRRFFHKTDNLFILNVPVHPGDPIQEHSFVKSVLPELDANEHDPSDAVILAAAIRVGADVLTRDKHDMFNARMENFLHKYNVRVFNKFH